MPSKNSTKLPLEEKKENPSTSSSQNCEPKYKVIPIENFQREAKRLVKKYPSLLKELPDLRQTLSESPESGTPLGNGCFKIRLAIASKHKGKSGGGRVITYVKYIADTVYLLSIYDKSEQSTITNAELDQLLAQIR